MAADGKQVGDITEIFSSSTGNQWQFRAKICDGFPLEDKNAKSANWWLLLDGFKQLFGPLAWQTFERPEGSAWNTLQ